jgi:hypothetical protein
VGTRGRTPPGIRYSRHAIALWFLLCGAACRANSTPASQHSESAVTSVQEPIIVDTVGSVRLRVLTAEARDALGIIATRDSARRARQWHELVATEEYRRLKQRDSAFGRLPTDSSFYAWLTSDSLATRAPELQRTFTQWVSADIAEAVARMAAYLPPGTPVRAALYFLIKPRANTFVYNTDNSPAIFVAVDPSVNRAQFENEIAHELHHMGYAAACRTPGDTASPKTARDTAVMWMSAFGEGWAMLAAAGGPNVNPHWESDSADRARWDSDYAHVGDGMAQLTTFFTSMLDRRLSNPDSVQAHAMAFFGVQGPWYTVRYLMTRTVEVTYGRARLLSTLCDPAKLVLTYQEAARAADAHGGHLPLWPQSLLASLRTST